MKPQLFPREPRRMKQPAKDLLRQQLAMAADHIERVTAENQACAPSAQKPSTHARARPSSFAPRWRNRRT
ncbi:hypothetical protein [Xanthomonas hortorum]|uniref:Uncharacterized protein n=1 Tax=Xanthomonas hortorum pv. hederae TaxID=453603 RepID=A0A9X3Z0F8_9XANT|nr:hypothetical protein [Xanthomonas hortorum]MCE4371008.1 hypothetical protein [Xanthomonas hortorum pv. hederae]MDC8637962.1 hypothetical protein [Xanthomonas hortorum pv. hederae]PUF00526.1 hypothetical protein C7T87_08195 [Xanthomonas hortorum pv. hederae]